MSRAALLVIALGLLALAATRPRRPVTAPAPESPAAYAIPGVTVLRAMSEPEWDALLGPELWRVHPAPERAQ